MSRKKTDWKPNKRTTLTEEQQKTYFRAVEKVNRQLRRLAAHEREKGGKITQYAYRVLQADIKSFFGPGKKRFSTTDVPRDMRSYIARMNAIEAFYRMPTATLTGSKQIYDKRAASLSQSIGLEMSGDQLRRVFESGLFDQLMRVYGSATALKAVGEITETRKNIKEQLDAGQKIIFSGEAAELLNTPEISSKYVDEQFMDAVRKYVEG